GDGGAGAPDADGELPGAAGGGGRRLTSGAGRRPEDLDASSAAVPTTSDGSFTATPSQHRYHRPVVRLPIPLPDPGSRRLERIRMEDVIDADQPPRQAQIVGRRAAGSAWERAT